MLVSTCPRLELHDAVFDIAVISKAVTSNVNDRLESRLLQNEFHWVGSLGVDDCQHIV